ncbi:hypothetical protein KFE25_003491 [Diacronema lutheri]|uniref:Aminotransferase class I/classII large domain-containing protein n=2 Tax=Diacronema lutheri TaxID=2081491 RepID=A0A8J5XHQ1_DIALT|nr:hypothetical protein KFE25_003491 [Diacronema lutheri]
MSTGSYPRARFAVSPLVAGVATSKTVAIFSQTSEMKSRGEAVNAALCVGQPDFPPPPAVVEATAEAAAKGLTTYTALLGTLELRRAICEYLVRAKGTPYAEDEVMVSGGGKQAIYEAMVALCQPGDEVVIPAPYYTSYPDIVGLAGATSVIMPTHPSDDYVPTVAELERALNERTRILILCNPCNPTGAVIPRERLEQIAQLLRRPDLAHILVLSDEIYEAITYGVPHVSFAALDGMKERTLTINGFSKAYSMTGYRLGYLAAPVPIIKAASRLQAQISSCASSISQHAGVAALTRTPDDLIAGHVAALCAKRDLALELLRQIPNVSCPTPEGAFYLLPDISAYFGRKTAAGELIGSAEAACIHLLHEYKVALVPGEAFGAPATVRLSYAATHDEIRDAITKLGACLSALRLP